MRLSLGYMTREQELEVLSRPSAQTVLNELQAVVTPEETAYVRTAYREVKVSEEVKHYLMDIVEATRTQSGFVSGVSTRGALALYQAAQAYASLQGREYVIPEDIKGLAPAVLSHRISLGSSMNAEAPLCGCASCWPRSLCRWRMRNERRHLRAAIGGHSPWAGALQHSPQP